MTDTILGHEVTGRPEPEHDHVSATYWEATTRGELLIQECPTCSHRQFYPRQLCEECGADPVWMTASGLGTLHTYTVVRANGVEPFRGLAPYVVGIVELDEGPRMMTNVVGCTLDDVAVGMRLEVQFVPLNETSSLPFWRPAER